MLELRQTVPEWLVCGGGGEQKQLLATAAAAAAMVEHQKCPNDKTGIKFVSQLSERLEHFTRNLFVLHIITHLYITSLSSTFCQE